MTAAVEKERRECQQAEGNARCDTMRSAPGSRASAVDPVVGSDRRDRIVAAIASYPYYGQSYVMSLLGKFLCYAIFALSIDLIWGFTGILSLGQAVYFGIGAYFVALSLKINYALEHPTRYGGRIPTSWSGTV